jgi:hypothetical protein
VADDLNPTPADARTSAPAATPVADEPSTTEIVALVVTGTDAEGGAVTPTSAAATPDGTEPAPATGRTTSATARGSAAASGPAPSAAATPDGTSATEPATVTGPAATGPATAPLRVAGGPATAAYAPPTKVSNETPTITRPAPRPAPVPRPAPPSASAPPPTVTPPPRPSAAPARPESDWAAEVADRIDAAVAKVRANTSDRLVGVARMVVFGLLAAVMGITALVLVLILFFRLLAIIPGPVWIPYVSLGAIFVLVGLLCWSKRTAKPSPA